MTKRSLSKPAPAFKCSGPWTVHFATYRACQRLLPELVEQLLYYTSMGLTKKAIQQSNMIAKLMRKMHSAAVGYKKEIKK